MRDKQAILDLGLKSHIVLEGWVRRKGREGTGENFRKRGSLSKGIKILHGTISLGDDALFYV